LGGGNCGESEGLLFPPFAMLASSAGFMISFGSVATRPESISLFSCEGRQATSVEDMRRKRNVRNFILN